MRKKKRRPPVEQEDAPTFIKSGELSFIGYDDDGYGRVIAPSRAEAEQWMKGFSGGKWVVAEVVYVRCTNPPSDPDMYSDKYAEWEECDEDDPGAHPAWAVYDAKRQEIIGPDAELRSNPHYDPSHGP